MKKVKISIISILLMLTFTLSGCSSKSVSTTKIQTNTQATTLRESSFSSETNAAVIIQKSDTVDNDTDYDIPEWDIVEENSLSFNITYNGQKQDYILTAPESGNYRFSLDINNTNFCYNVTIYEENHSELHSSSSNHDFNIQLKKDRKYIIEISQNEGLPECTVSVGIPNPVRTISDNTVRDIFRYTGQEDIYNYTAPATGIYGIELETNNVQYSYSVNIYDSKNSEIDSKNCNIHKNERIFMNPEFKQGHTYKFIISFDGEMPEDSLQYTVIINKPNEIKSTDSNIITDEFTFGGQENRYLYTPSKTAVYKLIFTDDNEPMSYDITFSDERNYIQGPKNNHNWNVEFELEKDMEYEITIIQKEEYGTYYFEIVEKE